MNITILHNRYQQPGGEDVVVAAESGLLSRAGHDVTVEEVSNDEIVSLPDRIGAFLAAPYDPDRFRWASELFARTRPEIVHVHNFFPLLTTAVHRAAKDAGAGVVQTLHNYRLLCAAATFVRNGQVCEKCLGGSRLWGVAHRCYRGSLAGSLAVVRMQSHAERRRVWHDDVHQIIVLTEFARQKFIDGGLPPGRLVVKPNFADPRPVVSGPRHGALFVGRLSAEKGIRTLIEAWRELPDVPLTVVGDGPERAAVEAAAPGNVRFLGHLPSNVVRQEMAGALFLVVPSEWYEGFPMVVAEAFASGLPVIASQIGALREIVPDGVAGLTFAPGNADELPAVVRNALADPARLNHLGDNARRIYEARFTPEINLLQLEAVYQEALRIARQKGSDRILP